MATINDANKVYCSGYYSACASLTTNNVANVYFTSYSASSDAVINSGGVGTMNVYFAAYSSGNDVTVNCDSGDYCYITCSTNGACSSTSVYGCNNYEITCDASGGIDCPTEFSTCPDPTSMFVLLIRCFFLYLYNPMI